MMNTEEGAELVLLGVIAGAHGIAGEVRVFAYNDDSDNLRQGRRFRLRTPGSQEAPLRTVQRSRRHKQFFLIKFEGIEERNAADAARGIEVLLRRDELIPVASGEVYFRDLVGIPVSDDEGRALGLIRQVMAGPATDILVVAAESPDGTAAQFEHLIACHDEAFVEMDVPARRIVVRAGSVVTNRV